jgi:hypothetical protein
MIEPLKPSLVVLAVATVSWACGGGSGRARDDGGAPGTGGAATGGAAAGSGGAGGSDGDAGVDGPSFVYSCGAFAVGAEWTTAAGYRSAVVAVGAPLAQPVAIVFGGARFGDGTAIVVDQGAGELFKIDTTRGAGNVTSFVGGAAWAHEPMLLTSIAWDADQVLDGNLYVGDQGSDGDGDSVIFRVDPAGATTVFVQAPGPGLDDVYGLALLPAGEYQAGLYVSGDTDGAGPGVGRFAAAGGQGVAFATFAGVEAFAVDRGGRFGGGLFAAMPAGGGYSGDDTISRINPDGTKATPPLVQGTPGVHALVFAPPGPFGGDAYAASWGSGKILRITPAGLVTELASGLLLTNYDGNILAFSPDGRVLLVADRQRSRIVCIEQAN